MSHALYTTLGILLLCGTSIITRTLPFLFAEQLRSHREIQRLGNQLPAVIMLLLVMFTLRDAPVLSTPYALPELAGLVSVVSLQWRLGNTIFSVLTGTICYLFVSSLF